MLLVQNVVYLANINHVILYVRRFQVTILQCTCLLNVQKLLPNHQRDD